MGAIKTAATSRALTTTLAADPDLAGTIAATNSFWLVDVAMRLTGAEGHGGFRFNMRYPAGASALVFFPWRVASTGGHFQPVVSVPEDGIGQNIGASSQDYFTFDNQGMPFSVVIFGTIGFHIGATVGAVSLEWCQHRSVAIPTVMGIGSGFSTRAP